MRPALLFLVVLAVAACRHVDYDVGPVVPTVEVRVRRTAPDTPLITLGHHDERSFIDTRFLVLAPKEYQGLTFRLKVMPDYQGRLFDAREFRLRLAENLVLSRDRERKNADGTTTVWSDTDGHWNFEAMTLDVIKEANQALEPTATAVTSPAAQEPRQP